MIICEKEFERPDRDNPNYSMCEVDYYAWIPQGSDLQNHRLSLRKNLRTGEFEVYRCFSETRLVSRKGLTVITGDDTGQEEIAFKSKNLGEAIYFADGEWNKYHGQEAPKEPDKVCQHKYPVKAMFCEG